ncbi:MAG: hypothetical protein ACQEXJ_14650 [Myxococcota bacterium]
MRLARAALGFLQVIVGLSGLVGGWGLLSDPTGAALDMPLSLLDGTPFGDYLVPGVVLFTVIGVGNTLAVVLWRRRPRVSITLGAALGVFLVCWIVAQVAWIGLVNALQPTYFGFGLAEAVLGFRLRGPS